MRRHHAGDTLPTTAPPPPQSSTTPPPLPLMHAQSQLAAASGVSLSASSSPPSSPSRRKAAQEGACCWCCPRCCACACAGCGAGRRGASAGRTSAMSKRRRLMRVLSALVLVTLLTLVLLVTVGSGGDRRVGPVVAFLRSLLGMRVVDDYRRPVQPYEADGGRHAVATRVPRGGASASAPASCSDSGIVDEERDFVERQRRIDAGLDDAPVRAREPLLYWSTDDTVEPVYHFKNAMRQLVGDTGFEVEDNSLSPDCASVDTCARKLRFLTRDRVKSLTACPESFKRLFYARYLHDDKYIGATDAFLCQHAAALCELYMPFQYGRSLFVYLSSRFDYGRDDNAVALRRWAYNIRKIAWRVGNLVAASNRYDQIYTYYYTGMMPLYLPIVGAHISARYDAAVAPRSGTVLLLQRDRRIATLVAEQLRQRGADVSANAEDGWSSVDGVQGGAAGGAGAGAGAGAGVGGGGGGGVAGDAYSSSERNVRFVQRVAGGLVRDTPALAAKHRAVIAVPEQVSLPVLSELYWMGVPLLLPSRQFYTSLHVQHGVLTQLVEDRQPRGRRRTSSTLPKHASVCERMPDPQAETDFDSMHYWLQYADWYQWRNVVYFDSWDDALRKVKETNFARVSRAMLAENRAVRGPEYEARFTYAINFIRDYSKYWEKKWNDDYYGAMADMYGVDYLSVQDIVSDCF